MSVKKKKSRRHRKINGGNNDTANGDDENDSSSASDSDEEPDVADLESSEICQDNHTSCISDNIDAVLEVFDEETCVNLLIGYYEVASKYKLQHIQNLAILKENGHSFCIN